mmetsp:Transcript_15006/g.17325  ORF Transcript_15006/g.17325 Transcript_15006/m.17325 type:complete len:84 (+) Transcript_15006:603-854(+)
MLVLKRKTCTTPDIPLVEEQVCARAKNLTPDLSQQNMLNSLRRLTMFRKEKSSLLKQDSLPKKLERRARKLRHIREAVKIKVL